jgi:hypothetical protein
MNVKIDLIDLIYLFKEKHFLSIRPTKKFLSFNLENINQWSDDLFRLSFCLFEHHQQLEKKRSDDEINCWRTYWNESNI